MRPRTRHVASYWRLCDAMCSRRINPSTLQRWYSGHPPPPTFFGESGLPMPVETHRQAASLIATSPKPQPRAPLLDLTAVLAVLALSYLAIDNYRTRMGLQARLDEQATQSQEAQDVMASQLKAQSRKRDLQVLNERKQTQMRQMKLSLHVAMLRKQLIDQGLEPVSIDELRREFDRSVRMENSVSNVSGTALWVVDSSPAKPHVSNVREYDTKKPRDS
ncbi:LAMI_0C02234g1_1 [Lachancea mirantina]|uniref:LAMI_0C02234g1_1 n=1 Tax=Lachancea mirantina TaxID=1230905 RepID=A0A1G4J128_9SACH|nr:LAMI_0C02234g1_1 [Lachancea mirantina]